MHTKSFNFRKTISVSVKIKCFKFFSLENSERFMFYSISKVNDENILQQCLEVRFNKVLR